MSKQFRGFDISSIISEAVAYYIDDIEGMVIEMVKEDDMGTRSDYKDDIQRLICELKEFAR